MKQPLIVLTGPTASGKTALSIGLAKAIGGEIISADSMQVYRQMDIGTAKIRPEEMEGIPHYLVDVLEPDASFNVVIFQQMAREAMARIRANGHVPIIVGGTGFYIQAILNDIDFKIKRLFKEGGDNVYGLGATLEGFDVNPLMYEFVFDQAWDYSVTTDQWITNWSMCRGGNQDANIIKAWRALHQKIYTEHATCGQSVLMNARPRLTGTKSWNTNPGIHYANNDLWQIWKELLKARNINNSDFRFDVINIGRQVLGNLFSEYRDQFTACYNRKDTTGMREWSTRMDNLLLDVDRLLSCDATLSIGKWLQDARNCGATVSEKDYYEENARCILTVWGQQDTQLNDYANRGWGGLTRSFYRERWKRFTDGVIAAVSEDKPFDEDKFHQDITQFEYNWTLQKDSFPIVSEEDPIQIADSLILKYDTYFTKAQ